MRTLEPKDPAEQHSKTRWKDSLKGLAHVTIITGAYCTVFGILMYPVIDAARRVG